MMSRDIVLGLGLMCSVCSVEGFHGTPAFSGVGTAGYSFRTQGLGVDASTRPGSTVRGGALRSSPLAVFGGHEAMKPSFRRSLLLPLSDSGRMGGIARKAMSTSATPHGEEEIMEGRKAISWAEGKVLLGKIAVLAKPFWAGGGDATVNAWTWTIATFSLALFSTLYAVVQSFVQRFFWNALNAKDIVKFNKFLALYVGILLLGPPILVMFDWAKNRMALQWRDALTRRYLVRPHAASFLNNLSLG